MAKRVIDIFSPKEVEKKEVKKEIERVSVRKPEIKIPVPVFKKGVFCLFIILSLGFFVSFFTLSKVKIEIWPETDTINAKSQLTVDKRVGTADFQNKAIPGEVFEIEKSVTETFSASGKTLKEEKAGGTITVYNAYSTSPQVLIAATRFVSADGKIFKTPSKVTIPGASYDEKGKLVPGEIDIKIAADQAGEEYNIGPSTFSIPGFAGTARYTKFYAKSFQSFTGGFSQELPQVTKEDLDKAKESLTKKVKAMAEDALKEELQKEEIASQFAFTGKAIQTDVIETFSLTKAGDNVQNFNYQVKAKSKTLIFKKENLKSFGREFILTKIPQSQDGIQKVIYEESLKIEYSPETVNLDSGKIILSLDVSAQVYPAVDLANLKNEIKRKSLAEAKLFLENQTGIVKVKVEGWPFWVKSVPKDENKTEVYLRFD